MPAAAAGDARRSKRKRAEESIQPRHDKHLEKSDKQPLDKVLEMCGGEIVPGVTNIQLFHFIMAYGHCGGGEGVCMDTIPRVMFVQSRIYERYISSVSHTFSGAMANNSQSKFVPNDWVDTFCKLTLDVDAGIPRVKKFCSAFKAALAHDATSSSSSRAAAVGDHAHDAAPSLTAEGAAAAAADHAKMHQILLWQLGRDMESCTGLIRRACIQCYDRRLMDMPSLKHPDTDVGTSFPAQLISRIVTSAPGSQDRRELVQMCRYDH